MGSDILSVWADGSSWDLLHGPWWRRGASFHGGRDGWRVGGGQSGLGLSPYFLEFSSQPWHGKELCDLWLHGGMQSDFAEGGCFAGATTSRTHSAVWGVTHETCGRCAPTLFRIPLKNYNWFVIYFGWWVPSGAVHHILAAQERVASAVKWQALTFLGRELIEAAGRTPNFN